MTVSDLQLGMNQGTTNYGPFSYGSHAGEPVVDFSVSQSDQNKMPIQSIDSIFENNNWKRHLSSGFARLQYNGKNVFDEKQTHEISELSRILDARFVDFELGENELQQMPPRDIKNTADYYRIFVPDDYNFDEEVFQRHVDNANRHGNVDFLFKVSSDYHEKYVKEVSREFGIYDSHIWLFPKGRKAKTVSERLEKITKIAERNTWNVSPRLGIMANAREEIIDE